MDYESRIAFAVELPYLLAFGILLVRSVALEGRPRWMFWGVRTADVAATIALAVVAILGYFEWISQHFAIPPQTSRQAGAASAVAVGFVLLLDRSRGKNSEKAR